MKDKERRAMFARLNDASQTTVKQAKAKRVAASISEAGRLDRFTGDFEVEELLAIEKGADSRITDVADGDERGQIFEMEDGSKWLYFDTETAAKEAAVEQVEREITGEDFKSTTSFSKDFIKDFIKISDTDRRIIAGEEANEYAYEHLSDDEALSEAGLEDEFLVFGDTLVETAREDVESSKYDEIYDALEDPVEYFVNNKGLYTVEELLKQNFVYVDSEEAARAAVDIDGWEHFLGVYDGESVRLPTGGVITRVN